MSQLTRQLKRQLDKKSSVEKLLTLNQHKIRLGLSKINKVIKKLKIIQKPDIKYLTIKILGKLCIYYKLIYIKTQCNGFC